MNILLPTILTSAHLFYLFVFAISLSVLSTILYLFYQLNHPEVITYPWPSSSSFAEQDSELTDQSTEVVLAGSYNPPHYGHIEMIKYLVKRFKRVHVVIGMNPNKFYQVLPARRAELLERMIGLELREDCKVKVKVEVVSDYIWRYAKSNGAKILFRGIRTWERDGREERALHKLNLLGPLVVGRTWPLQTCYLEGKPEFIDISSTWIRNLCGAEFDEERMKTLESAVPKEVAEEVYLAYH